MRKKVIRGTSFWIKCSKQKFSQVDPDHAQEWLNRRGKIAGGIIGITRTISALMRWNLSYNARSFIADQTFDMFDLTMDRLVTKETTTSRKGRDNSDENKLFDTIVSFKVFSKNMDTLMNIATKDIATDDIQNSLITADDNGEIRMLKFINCITKGTGSILAD